MTAQEKQDCPGAAPPCIVQLMTLITGDSPAAYSSHWSCRSSLRADKQ